MPARRKFLRAEQTELSHIRQLFLVHALAHPSIGMSLKVDERMIHNLPMAGTMEDRVSELYGQGFFEQLLPIDHAEAGYTMTGYAGLPQTGRKDRHDQYIFVNGRPAAAPVVYHALNEAYHALIAKGRYPAVFLFIAMDPTLVDVNVHPTKKEVRFRHPNALRDAVLAALNKALTVPSDQGQVPFEDDEPVVLPPPNPVRPAFEAQKEMDDLLVRPALVDRRESKPGRGMPETASPLPANSEPDASTAATPSPRCRTGGRVGDHVGAVPAQARRGDDARTVP